MRFCSARARASSALMSSRVLRTFGFARIAVVATSTAGASCARTSLDSGATTNTNAPTNTDRRTPFSIATSPPTSHLHFDQPRPRLGDAFRQGLDEIVDIGNRAALNAHAPGERYKVQCRAVDLQHVERALPRLARADAVELAAQDLVDAVGEHDGQHVEVFAGLRPQRLQSVHRAAVADHADHLAIRTGHRGAGCDRRR